MTRIVTTILCIRAWEADAIEDNDSFIRNEISQKERNKKNWIKIIYFVTDEALVKIETGNWNSLFLMVLN